MLTKYDDVYFVLRHPEIFTTRGATPLHHRVPAAHPEFPGRGRYQELNTGPAV